MNGLTGSPRPRRPFAAALETAACAGGWANALIVLAMLSIPVLARVAGSDRGAYAGLVLAAIFVMFWAMLAGGRLVGLCATAAAQRLPRWRTQAWLHAAAALLLAVLLPAVPATLDSPVGYPLAVAALGAGLALGLFWVSLPPWMMWLLIAAGVVARWLPPAMDDATLRAWAGSPAGPGTAALVLLAACAGCWVWLGRRREPPGAWSTPLALALATGAAARSGAQHAAYGSSLLAADAHLGGNLRDAPGQALAIALGPGFAGNTFKGLVVTHGPVLGVALFWLLLGLGADRDAGMGHVGLVFAPLMVLVTALAPLLRLETLFMRPGLGLHELALLPGLPRRPALALAGHLARQIAIRGLPALTVMAGFAMAVGAAPRYYSLLLWACASGAFLLAGAALLSLHSRPGRWACMILMALVIPLVLAGMMAGMSDSPPVWLPRVWSAALLAGLALLCAAAVRLRALPHPWLQN